MVALGGYVEEKKIQAHLTALYFTEVNSWTGQIVKALGAAEGTLLAEVAAQSAQVTVRVRAGSLMRRAVSHSGSFRGPRDSSPGYLSSTAQPTPSLKRCNTR